MLEVLIGDEDARARTSVAFRLAEAGHRVHEAADGEVAMGLTRERVFDVMVFDVALPRVDGLTLFRHVRRESPATSVILMAKDPRVSDAIAALKEGALDFLTKPVDCDALLRGHVGRIAERRALRSAFDEARAWLVGKMIGAALIGTSPRMAKLVEQMDAVAPSDSAVLIRGESGTGKDVLARTLYARSKRAARPFVSVDCSRDEGTIERELFGEGGQLAAARGGTIFFDEIGEMPLSVQAKLVRVLRDEPPDARMISATHHDLDAAIRGSLFREDLYWLVSTVELEVPALRDRKSDLPLLLHHFLERLTPHGQVPPGVSPAAWAALEVYSFPGNVRELARAVEHAIVLSHGSEIDVVHLPAEIRATTAKCDFSPLAVALGEFERAYLVRALKMCGGDHERAAEALAVHPRALTAMLRRHGIDERSLVSSRPPPLMTSSATMPVAMPANPLPGQLRGRPRSRRG